MKLDSIKISKFVIIFTVIIFFLGVIFTWVFFPLRIFNIYSPSLVNNHSSKCFWERDNEYNCFWETGITNDLRKSFNSRDDFESYLNENFLGCFDQVNLFLSGFQNGWFFVGQEGNIIEDFKISDDVCGEYSFNLVFENNEWKIDSFER